MGVERIIFRHESRQPAFEIALRRGIRILLDHETGGSVPNEDRAETFPGLRPSDDRHDLSRELEESLASRDKADLVDHRLVPERAALALIQSDKLGLSSNSNGPQRLEIRE
jgi:hypothetical protein